MLLDEDDLAALWDMQCAILEIQDFTVGFSEDVYPETLWLQRVVERNLEILGEAARRYRRDFSRSIQS